jgi:serine/threonine-protein kinase
MKLSRPGFPQPEPVGAFVYDESPYLVRDLAGCIFTWVADIHGESDMESTTIEIESEDTEGYFRMTRGGSWGSAEVYARSASRYRAFARNRATYTGFRLAKDLPLR